jgi:hypothetical protein
MDETEKYRFDALMKLAEFTSAIREKRRELEWKVSLGVWTVTAAALVYLKGCPVVWLLILLALLIAAHTWLWVRTNYNSSERDAGIMYFYVEQAIRIILPESVPDPGKKQPVFAKKLRNWDFLKHEPIWFEIAVTMLLGLAVIVLSRSFSIPNHN